MKINWGTGIVIGMVLFISFIMFMVITMITDENYDHEMVTESYYEKGMVYQQEIDAETNAKNFNSELKLRKTELGWLLSFPMELANKTSNGSVSLYRPSNEKLDFTLPLQLEGNEMLIPKDKLLEGSWKLRVSWEIDGKPYLLKKDLTY